MDARLKDWKREAERLWAAPAFDHRAAGQLTAEIAHADALPALQQAARQALPSLRAACARGAERGRRDLAQWRFGALRDCLHALDPPRFGRRQTGERKLAADEHHRRVLGLPLGRRLFAPDIAQAYKQAAKRVHPDSGGSQAQFLELTAARDALMKGL
jgi:hypothetical protein